MIASTSPTSERILFIFIRSFGFQDFSWLTSCKHSRWKFLKAKHFVDYNGNFVLSRFYSRIMHVCLGITKKTTFWQYYYKTDANECHCRVLYQWQALLLARRAIDALWLHFPASSTSCLMRQTNCVPCSIPDSVNCVPANIQSHFIDRKQTILCSILMMNAVLGQPYSDASYYCVEGIGAETDEEFFDAVHE